MSHHFIEFKNVSYSYPNGPTALSDISFTIKHGEKIAVLGNNGSGKTTLLMHMNGLLLPTTGEINMGGIKICKQTLPLIRQKVGLVFQNADDQLFMPTVWDDVAFGPQNMKMPQEEVENRVNVALLSVNAIELKNRACHQLSGGQKRIVAIATVLSMFPDILVMDEPTANLDFKAKKELITILKSFSHACIISTHDMKFAQEVCDRAILLQNGQIILDTTIKDAINTYLAL